ncbi:MAG: response regulator [Nitrospirales bacterium]
MKRVLIVDDEADHRLLLKDMLGANGYVCEVAGDGKDALNVLRTTSVDVILTDFNMPRMNGLELIENLSKQTYHLMVPVILVTSQDPDCIPSLSSHEWLFTILSKPYQWGKLLDTVEEATESAPIMTTCDG